MIVPDKAIPSYARLTLPSFFAITNAEVHFNPLIRHCLTVVHQ